MKFSQSLSEKENPAWKAQYISYDELKDMLYDGLAKAPKVRIDMQEINFEDYVSRFDEYFFRAVGRELDKVNRFQKEKTREMMLKFLNLKADMELSIGSGTHSPDIFQQRNQHGRIWNAVVRKIPIAETKKSALRVSFRNFYIEAVSLAKYLEINYHGFRKVLKKHDKIFGNAEGHTFLKTQIDTSDFHTTKDAETMIRETEHVVTTYFEDGNRAKAMKMLRVPHREDRLNTWTAFKLGLMIGTIAVLFFVLAVSGLYKESKENVEMKAETWRVIIRFYRGSAVLCLYICLIGFDIYVWSRRGINHIYIFDLNIHDNLVHHHFWNISAALGVIWALSIVAFINSQNIGLPTYVSPLILLCLQFSFLFNPLPIGFWSSRKWLLKILGRILIAPFHRVSFADFWMCDQLSSLITIVLDYQYLICFYLTPGVFTVDDTKIRDARTCITTTKFKCSCDRSKEWYRHVIRGLPAFLRVIQCVRRFYDAHLVFPHLVNGWKYVLSLLVVIFSGLKAINGASKIGDVHTDSMSNQIYLTIWITASILSSLMSYWWDVKMDWGLGNCRSENLLLRNTLLYPNQWVYYLAISVDLFLRFSWAVSWSLTEMDYIDADIMLTITTPVEIIRRCAWNLFRLENEQIHNNEAQEAAQGEAISKTSVLQGEEKEMIEILRMMDETDGVPKRPSILLPRAQSKISGLSSKFVADSKSELFTKVSQSQAGSHGSDFSSEEKINTQQGFCSRLKHCFCSCFLPKHKT